MWKVVPKGELKRKVQQKNLLVDTIFNAEPTDFRDVQVITLKQWLLEQAYEHAWNMSNTDSEVEEYTPYLLTTIYSRGKEFVRILPTSIQVCVHSTTIDDWTIDRAIALLSEIDDLTTERKIEVSEEIQVYDAPNQQKQRDGSNAKPH